MDIALKSAYETDNWLMVIKHSRVFQKVTDRPNPTSGIHPSKRKVEDFEKANIEIIKMLIALMKKLE